MREHWESESLRWLHELREENYKRAKGKPLRQLPPGPTPAARTLARKLDLHYVSPHVEETVPLKRRAQSR